MEHIKEGFSELQSPEIEAFFSLVNKMYMTTEDDEI